MKREKDGYEVSFFVHCTNSLGNLQVLQIIKRMAKITNLMPSNSILTLIEV